MSDDRPDILVIGIAVVDAVARPVDRFPSPGGLRFFDDLVFTTGGNAVNCAIALRAMGTPAEVVARVGRDPLGAFVTDQLRRHGVPTTSIVVDERRSTSFSFVSVPSSGERSFLHTTGANATLRGADVPDELLRIKRFVFVTGTMLMDALDGMPTRDLLVRARAAGGVTLMDTVFVEGIDRHEWRRRVMPALPVLDYFIPSEAEARAITGEDEPLRAAEALRDAGARRVVIKLGEQGVLCLDERAGATLVSAYRVGRPVDTTGAGDCWAAGFLLGLREGRTFPDSARVGNAVAAVSVTGAGASTALVMAGGRERVLELLRG